MRITPNYIRARYWAGTRNKDTEEFYFDKLTTIKGLIKQLPNQSDRLVYEQNRKHEVNNLENLYDFLSPQIRFHLLCWFDLKYCIHYTIAESPIKKELADIIDDAISREYNMVKIDLEPDYRTFYSKAMEFRKNFTHFL